MGLGEHLVFVYGTLRRGEVNHPWLAGARAEGEGQLSGARLHDLGPFPMAVPGDGVVHGEVYALSDAGLARLDRLEGHPRLYRRQRLPLADGRRVWVYLGRPQQVRQSPLLVDGRWGATGLNRPGRSPRPEPPPAADS